MAQVGDRWVSADGRIELRCGGWHQQLGGVVADHLVTDAPYSARTHAKQRHGRSDMRYGEGLAARGISYIGWSPADVRAFVRSWSPRIGGWFCSLTDSELYPVWRNALRAAGRYVFAPLPTGDHDGPIPCIQHAMNVRLAGDGPSNWTCWLVVARPVGMGLWGTTRAHYMGASVDVGQNALDRSRRAVAGAKPRWLMQEILNDYSRPGDLICDPCAGGGTTLLAAAMEGRRAIGSELDPATYALAVDRLRGLGPGISAAKPQGNLFAGLVR